MNTYNYIWVYTRDTYSYSSSYTIIKIVGYIQIYSIILIKYYKSNYSNTSFKIAS